MNIVNKLTLRHMKQNKRRTLVTIIGVIISVAMITAVMTIGISFQDLMKRQSIAQNGFWHAIYHQVSPEQADVIGEDEATKTLLLWQEQGFATLEGLGLPSTPNKPYVAISAYDKNGFTSFPMTFIEGRLPQKENEIVVPKSLLKDVKGANFAVGDEIELALGTRYLEDGVRPDQEKRSNFTQNDYVYTDGNKVEEKLKDVQTLTYKVVGLVEQPTWEQSWSPAYVMYTYLDASQLQDDAQLNAGVIVKKPDQKTYEHAEQLAANLGVKYNYNNDLLRYDYISPNNGMTTMMITLTVIIMSIVIVGSISLIYNAFGISVADRSRYLGMLASVGATRRQKRNSVFFEGAVISLISIPLGLIGGLVGLSITFWSINNMLQGLFEMSETLYIKVTPLTMIVSVGISLVTVFLSTWWPARRAARVSPIDAIRQTIDIKLSKKKVKNNPLVRKLFGIEADIALKNLKRNKRRYQITVFSLIVSIVLFLSVSFFTDSLKQGMNMGSDGINYDLEVSGLSEEDNAKIIALDSITTFNELHDLWANTNVPISQVTTGVKKTLEGQGRIQNNAAEYQVRIYSMSDNALKQFAKEQGIAADSIFATGSNNAILINSISYYSQQIEKKVAEAPILNAKQMALELTTPVSKEVTQDNGTTDYVTEDVKLPSVHITELVEEYPMGIIKGSVGPGDLILLVSESTLEKITPESEKVNMRSELYITSDDPMKLEQDIYALEEIEGYYINNKYEARQRDQQMIVLMNVFTYGFIALITLISMANILNTISTGIQLRRREFAMLRSMGMTKQGFNRMINYESIFYGMKSLLYGLPISGLIMVLIYRSMNNALDYTFQLPWVSIIIAIVAVFIIVSISMAYSGSKVKKGSIVEAIKQENM